MGYLEAFEHDAFVSYAHTGTDINSWSKQLVKKLQQLVASGLAVAEDKLELWIDDKTEGNIPLTENLKTKVHRSGLLIVLLTHRYLESEWCNKELDWFEQTIEAKKIDLEHPVFVIQLHDIERERWPKILREMPGHNFIGDRELNLPKGLVVGEQEPIGKDYHQAVTKVASEIVKHLKKLREREKEKALTERSQPGFPGNPQMRPQTPDAAPIPQSIFIVTDNDKDLERSVRRTMNKLDILAYPFESDASELRDLEKLNQRALLRELSSSKAIFLLQGKIKRDDPLWQISNHRFIRTKLKQCGRRPTIAIIDGPPDPRLNENLDPEQEPAVFLSDTSEFSSRITNWLASVPDIDGGSPA